MSKLQNRLDTTAHKAWRSLRTVLVASTLGAAASQAVIAQDTITIEVKGTGEYAVSTSSNPQLNAQLQQLANTSPDLEVKVTTIP